MLQFAHKHGAIALVNSASSEDRSLRCGVPRGSVLGPILFIVGTRQLGRFIEDHGLSRNLFADDTKIYKSFIRILPLRLHLFMQLRDALSL